MAVDILNPQPAQSLPQYLPANDNTKIPKAQLGWLRPTSRATPISEMKARLEEDGYVFVKGVIPREDVLKMREQYASTSAFRHRQYRRPKPCVCYLTPTDT
jgi:hypothetical protein